MAQAGKRWNEGLGQVIPHLRKKYHLLLLILEWPRDDETNKYQGQPASWPLVCASISWPLASKWRAGSLSHL